MKYIDRTPPAVTGDVKKDIEAMNNYLFYLQEMMNGILRAISKNGG